MTPSYALGIFFIFLVSIIWAAASIVVQHLYRDMDFDSPFLLTYVSTSLFVLFLPTRLLWERRKKIGRWICFAFSSKDRSEYSAVDIDDNIDEDSFKEEEEKIIPWRNSHFDVLAEDEHSQVMPTAIGQTNPLPETVEMTNAKDSSGQVYEAVDDLGHEEILAASEGNNSKEGRTDAEIRENHLINEDLPFTPRPKISPGEFETKRSLHTNETSSSTFSVDSDTAIPTNPKMPHLLSHVDHICMALRIGPVWFLSNYFYNTSLAYTSISSSTVLASTGSLFTFLFAVTCGDEKVNLSKLAGVLLCFVGSVLTGLSDAKAAIDYDASRSFNETDFDKPTASLGDVAGDDSILLQSESTLDNHKSLQLLGDLAGLISAIGYGTYTVLIRNLCPKDESRMSMQLLLGYVGAINGLVLLPVVIKLVFFDSCALPDDDSPSDNAGAGLDGASEESFSSFSPCERITMVVMAYLLGKAFFDNVLSDYLWARAVILTSATVATVGLGLTIPLAFFSDWFMGHSDVVSVRSVAGAVAVLFGFIFVNCGETIDKEGIAEEI